MIQLVDPQDRSEPLVAVDGVLKGRSGRRYPIIDGIPRFTPPDDPNQAQTSATFAYKWRRQPDWGMKPEHQAVVWSTWKDFFGWDSPDELKRLMQGKVVLDAGCGSGSAMLQFVEWPSELVAADISTAVDECRKHFGTKPHVSFVQSDLNQLPFADAVFDVVWSCGVMHHTPSTFEAARALARHLRRGGHLIAYVYRRKGPIREFVDDYLRDRIAPLDPASAWERMEVLTRLAQRLSAITGEVVVDDDFDELGLKRGRYPVQRFIYQNVMKCFWNDGLSFDENVHVNFDWYHPRYAQRQSVDEVRSWLPPLQLREVAIHESDSGISVIAEKQ